MSRITMASAAILALLATPALADTQKFDIIIKDHKFSPAEIKVPAGKKFELIVKNQDATPEEFESHSLKREKVIPGNSQATLKVGPLKPGTYEYFGEFNQSTAQGKIIAE